MGIYHFMAEWRYNMDIPNSFWKYYDLFRRKIICLEEFSRRSELPVFVVKKYLQEIHKKSEKFVER